MFAPRQLEDLAKNLIAVLPNSLQNLEKDIQQQFKEILQSAFARLDLVTRDEFDIQVKVLARTREKLDALQMHVDCLLQGKNSNQSS